MTSQISPKSGKSVKNTSLDPLQEEVWKKYLEKHSLGDPRGPQKQAKPWEGVSKTEGYPKSFVLVFRSLFGSLLPPFWVALALKARPGPSKSVSKKHLKNTCPESQKFPQNWSQKECLFYRRGGIFGVRCSFWGYFCPKWEIYWFLYPKLAFFCIK